MRFIYTPGHMADQGNWPLAFEPGIFGQTGSCC